MDDSHKISLVIHIFFSNNESFMSLGAWLEYIAFSNILYEFRMTES